MAFGGAEQQSAPAVLVLILNWNGWQDTLECLQSLQASTYVGAQVAVLDNGSSDGSLEQIAGWAAGAAEAVAVVRYDRSQAEAGGDVLHEAAVFGGLPPAQRLILIDNQENMGFAAGNNVGLRFALQRDYEYVLLLNNDTVVEATAIERLVQLLQEQQHLVGATPRIRYYDSDRIWNCGGDLTWYGSRKYHWHGRPAAATPQREWGRITFMTGCAAFLRTSLLHQVGLLTERFFFGEEDYEFSLRLQARGLALACCYEALVLHKVGRSIQRSSSQKVLRSSYVYHLARSIDLREHWSPLRWHLWRQWSMLYTLPLLWLRYHIGLRQLWELRRRLLHDSIVLHGVDKSRFERAMQGWYDSPE